MELNQYEIVLVNLDPTIGSEIKKTRPCLIISPNEMNKFLQTIIIAPITSTSKPYPTRIEIKGKETIVWVIRLWPSNFCSEAKSSVLSKKKVANVCLAEWNDISLLIPAAEAIFFKIRFVTWSAKQSKSFLS